jgi:hypothetical protein
MSRICGGKGQTPQKGNYQEFLQAGYLVILFLQFSDTAFRCQEEMEQASPVPSFRQSEQAVVFAELCGGDAESSLKILRLLVTKVDRNSS